MRTDPDAKKDPAQLEREVEEQRRQMSATMQALEDRFSSREIYKQASRYLRDHGRDYAESFSNSIKANPLPVALTAIGLLWMMVGQRPSTREPHPRYSGYSSGRSRGEQLKQAGSQLRERASSASDEASHKAQQMRERAGDAKRAIGERMGEMREGMSHSRARLGHALQGGRSNMEHWLHDQPMAIGAIGIALGALIGAVMPRTHAEDRMLGRISDEAKSKASELAGKGYEKVSAKAEELSESVSQKAEQASESAESSGKGQQQPHHAQPQAGPTSRSPSRGPSATP